MKKLMFIIFILLFVAAASAYDSELDNLWLTGWLNVTENVTMHGNLTISEYYFGDGSKLSNIVVSETDPLWTANQSSYSTKAVADTLYAPVNYGDDWNKTYADTLYADISVAGTVTSIATTAPISGGTITTTGTLSITADGITDTQLAYNTGQHLTTTSTPTFATISTGQGQYELFAMNQDVESTDAVTFATINTGQGANELYTMNQDVESTDDVQFQNITLSGNLTISQDNKFCYNAACTVYSYFNGTCLWHVGLTSVDIIC